MPETLPDSKTRRLCYFASAQESHKHVVVPNFVADEVEELREFVKFLYPPKGQTRFRLCAPDLNDLAWSVWDSHDKITLARGESPRAAISAARIRLKEPASLKLV